MPTPARVIPAEQKKAMLESYAIAFRPINRCGYHAESLGQATEYAFYISKERPYRAEPIIQLQLDEMKEQGILGPLKLLDLGCGHGGFVKHLNSHFKGQVAATGVTAFCPNQSDPAIKQGNIEFLFDIEGIQPNSYDMVVSRNTLTYLANPALCVLQAYDALKSNGLLLMDYLPLWGLNFDQHSYVASNLASKMPMLGTPVTMTLDEYTSSIACIFLKKRAHQDLELPLDYNGVGIDPQSKAPKTQYCLVKTTKGNVNSFFSPENKAVAPQKKITPEKDTASDQYIAIDCVTETTKANFSRLQFTLDNHKQKPLITKNQDGTKALLPIFWLRQLSPQAIDELSTELGCQKSMLSC